MNSPVEINKLPILELRGLGIPWKVPVLKKEILSECPMLVFLCEMKILVEEMKHVAHRLFFY